MPEVQDAKGKHPVQGARSPRMLGALAWCCVGVLLSAPAASRACECPDTLSLEDNLIRGSAPEDSLSPQQLQAYVALSLHKLAIDLASMAGSEGCPTNSPCNQAARRRSRRFTNTRSSVIDDKVAKVSQTRPEYVPDVPVFAGYGSLEPSRSPLISPTSTRDDTPDVPVVKGSSEGSYVRLVTPAPTSASRSTVPVVRGYQDPLHPTRRPPSVKDLQLSPEEQEALAVLLNGDRRTNTPASRSRPATKTPVVTGLSGKVGGKPAPTVVPVVDSPPERTPDCCSQKRLLQELDRRIAILRRVADQQRQVGARTQPRAGPPGQPGAGYPSPYLPYLHNLPIHPAHGADGIVGLDGFWSQAPLYAALPGPYFLVPRPTGADREVVRQRARGGLRSPCEADPNAPLDSKVRFPERRPSQSHGEEFDMHPPGDVSVDAKLGDHMEVGP